MMRLPNSAALAFPGKDITDIRAAHYFYQKELLKELLRLSPQLFVWGFDSQPTLRELVNHATEKNPKSLLDALSAPAVATPILCSLKKSAWPGLQEKIHQSVRAMIPHLLLEMAIRDLLPEGGAAVDCGDILTAPDLRATLSAEGNWRFKNGFVGVDGSSYFLRLSANTLSGRRPGAQGIKPELAYVLIDNEFSLALVDLSPIAQFEAHPDKNGSALNLGERSEEDWRAALEQAAAWVKEFWPELYEEIKFLLLQIVPVGWSKEKHFSASYREAIGSIYMSLHPDPVVMTTALIHEFQHNKLNLASYSDSLLENAFSPLYRSPVRPDPRPLWGILMAAHAFLPVAVFLRKMRAANHPASKTPDFEKRLLEIDIKNNEAVETLNANARWTTAGKTLWRELESLNTRHREEREVSGQTLLSGAAHED